MAQAWELGPREVHVWHLAADSEADACGYDSWGEVLSDGERNRADRFVLPSDRRRFVLAHGALRVILSRYTRIAPERLMFETNPHGRPELPRSTGAWPLRFNLSHTRGLVAVAISREYSVGVDVECAVRRPAADLLEVASRFFSPLETAALRRVANEECERLFLQLWTLKEACAKACGLGLSIPLHAFSFDLADDLMPTIRIDPSLGDDAQAWRFATAQPTPRHWLAVAVRAHGADPRFVVRPLALRDLQWM